MSDDDDEYVDVVSPRETKEKFTFVRDPEQARELEHKMREANENTSFVHSSPIPIPAKPVPASHAKIARKRSSVGMYRIAVKGGFKGTFKKWMEE